MVNRRKALTSRGFCQFSIQAHHLKPIRFLLAGGQCGGNLQGVGRSKGMGAKKPFGCPADCFRWHDFIPSVLKCREALFGEVLLCSNQFVLAGQAHQGGIAFDR